MQFHLVVPCCIVPEALQGNGLVSTLPLAPFDSMPCQVLDNVKVTVVLLCRKVWCGAYLCVDTCINTWTCWKRKQYQSGNDNQQFLTMLHNREQPRHLQHDDVTTLLDLGHLQRCFLWQQKGNDISKCCFNCIHCLGSQGEFVGAYCVIQLFHIGMHYFLVTQHMLFHLVHQRVLLAVPFSLVSSLWLVLTMHMVYFYENVSMREASFLKLYNFDEVFLFSKMCL